MAVEQIGLAGYAAQLKPFYSKKLLTTFRQKNVFNRFAVKESIPAGGGKNLEKRRFAAYSASTTALTEGTYNAEIQGTWITVSATVSQYGQHAKLSDVLDKQSFDRVVPANVENFSKTMAETLDTLTRNELTGGTTVQYASTAGSRAQVGSGMYLTLAELREALRTLKNNNAEPIPEIGGYAVFLSPNSMFDLQADQELIDIYQYADVRGKSNELFEAGFMTLPFGMRAIETTNARVFSSAGLSGADVQATLVVAREAYMTVDYEAMPNQIIVTPPVGGVSDPYKQITIVGYKASHGAARLQEGLIVRIEHVSSAKNSA